MIHTEENPTVYCVYYTPNYPYYDDNNRYHLEQYKTKIIERYSIEELYESMAQVVIDWTLKG